MSGNPETPSDRSLRMFAALRAAGFKLTEQRKAIVAAFADDRSHPTAQSIFERLRNAHPSMSFATVYNTLDALSKAGTSGVLKVGAKVGSAARFDPNTDPHEHAICERCERIVDLPVESCAPPDLQRDLIAREAGFAVRTVETIYRGLCRTCATVPAPRRA